MALNNIPAQDQLAALNVRESVRQCLLDNPGIGFGGQFESLKGWMKPSIPNTSASNSSKSASLAGGDPVHASRRTSHSTHSNKPQQSAVPQPVAATSVRSQMLLLKQQLAGDAAEAVAAMSALGSAVERGSAGDILDQITLQPVIKVMNAFPQDMQVQDVGCALVCALAWHPAGQAAMLKQPEVKSGEAVKAVKQALDRHPHQPVVQRHACMALWKLVSLSPSVQKQIVPEGAAGSLLKTIDRHKDNEDVCAAAAGALLASALGNERVQDELTKLGAQKSVKHVLSTHNSINFHGEFDGLRAWLKHSKKSSIKSKKSRE